ncbi:hypothetical protein HMPREF9309_00351 [Campylobacter ureolyticus ACS-301-V-Sch3b]|uniref:Uncharacterized protein n=1 Tax=Campylobacter ureolyticus ACS-301-V-Sch3b TaxID=883165 RepID=S3XIX7_9BACT|nr:hypothetical protein HMPREF9309_00351 [Campylobacter ureolyticus ACS-301-V-Sch3b]
MTPYSFAVMFGRGEVASYLASKSENKSLFKKLSVKISSPLSLNLATML